MTRIVTALIFILATAITCAQPAAHEAGDATAFHSGLFQRKSITIAPIAFPGGNAGVTCRTAMLDQFWFEQLKNRRFDYNNLDAKQLDCLSHAVSSLAPDAAIAEIPEKLRSCGIIAAVLESTANIDTLYARQKRMQKRIEASAASAKRIDAITGDQLLSLVNGSYIGVPVVAEFSGGADAYSAGKICWFRLQAPALEHWSGPIPEAGEVEIIPVLEEEFDSRKTIALELPTNISAEETAGRKAVVALLNAAYTLEDFKLRAMLQQVNEGLRLDLGDREGAYLDQGYKVYEARLREDNTMYSEYMGFIRLDEIGKTSEKMDALSSAYTIIPGGFDRGMSAVSHDQLLDVALRPGIRVLNVPAQSVNWFSNALFGNPDADLISEDATMAYAVHLEALFNVARYTGVSQLFVGIDGGIGILNSTTVSEVNTGSGFVSFTMNTPTILEASLVAHKKFWFSRFAGYAELLLGVNTLRLSGTLMEKDWSIDYGWNPGVGLNAGLSFAVNPDIIAGVSAGYRYAFPVSSLIVTSTNGVETEYMESDNELFWKENELEDIDFGGVRLGIEVSYSLPTF